MCRARPGLTDKPYLIRPTDNRTYPIGVAVGVSGDFITDSSHAFTGVHPWGRLPHALVHRPTILVTGGTGSLGRALVEHLMTATDAHVRVFSRDEHKQEAMARSLPPSERLTYILGDLRDERRVREAMIDCSHVVHAAALKTVPGGQRHMSEFVEVNIRGTEHVIRAAIDQGDVQCLFVSTDKAVDPLNAYGKTKAVAEELWIQANARGARRRAAFAAVRGGNVWLSAGSVGRVWAEQIKREGRLTVHNGAAVTRFHMRMAWWVGFVRRRLEAMVAGSTYVPVVPAWSLRDLAMAVADRLDVRLEDDSRTRPGDKLAEVMVAAHEIGRAWRGPECYAIAPSDDLRSVWRWPGEDAGYLSQTLDTPFASDTAARVTADELRACADDVAALVS